MSESSETPVKFSEKQVSLPKRIAKRAAPFVLAALAAFTPDKPISPTTITISPNPPSLAGQETKEDLKQLPPNVLVIDFAPNEPREGIKQTTFPDEELLASANIPLVVKSYIINRFGDHGEYVAFAMRKTWEKFGFVSIVNIHPLQDALNAQSVEIAQDELGNQEYILSIDPDKLAKVLEKYPDQKIVNLSLQLGKVGISMINRERKITKDVDYPTYVTLPDGKIQYYSPQHELITQSREEYNEYKRHLEEEVSEIVTLERPDPKPKEAYSKNEVQQNLPKLFELCKTFPDKLFVAAVGNEGEDLEAFQDRPENLLLVAEWNGIDERPEHGVYGADIYVDNDGLNIKHGSSFSTPVIAALGSIFAGQGLNAEKIKTRIEQVTDTVTFIVNGEEKKVKVFNPNKLYFTP